MDLSAVILAAGRGARLAPLTDRTPKCLLPVAGRAILDRQIDVLARAGTGRITVVTGHAADAVAAHIAGRPGVHAVRNPRHSTTDNLASCHAAREHFVGDATLLLNGDTLFEDGVLAQLLTAEPVPILIAIDRKPLYDADDMKITTGGSRLHRIGKHLVRCDGEAIGITLLRGEGRALFLRQVEGRLAAPDGERALYPEALDALAARGHVSVRSIEGRRWVEIDTAENLAAAEVMPWR
ncbi:MAG: phosphocholine cytidylyltransferase family protein [Alphaproteobacteria bacterium]|nr:phosphocholine cytidylyltransferase family protein [Alphaproteobacteria bacterium]MCW5742070.1 phosphocholine cytidylyltransferase family protein [Alphaproteobacteria bacterium]